MGTPAEIQSKRPRRSSYTERFEASLPYRYREAVADHLGIVGWLREQAERAARDEPMSTGLLLRGPAGRGKTWQMFGAGRALTAQGHWVAWAFVPDLLHDLRPGGPRAHPGGMDDLYTADVVLLDDLCAHKSSEWAEAELDVLIDRRWRDERPCIITTNVKAGGMGDALGERIASRLAGMCKPVHIDGPDRRRP